MSSLPNASEQLLNVVEVQAGGGLVEDVQDAGVAGVDEMSGELQALGFAAGKRGGGLAQAEIAETDFLEDLQPVKNAWGTPVKKCSASRTVMSRTS